MVVLVSQYPRASDCNAASFVAFLLTDPCFTFSLAESQMGSAQRLEDKFVHVVRIIECKFSGADEKGNVSVLIQGVDVHLRGLVSALAANASHWMLQCADVGFAALDGDDSLVGVASRHRCIPARRWCCEAQPAAGGDDWPFDRRWTLLQRYCPAGLTWGWSSVLIECIG